MDKEVLNRKEWNNPRNWHLGILGIYFSKVDTRLFVPKSTPAFGWTFNFGHRYIVLVLAGLFMSPFIAFAIGMIFK